MNKFFSTLTLTTATTLTIALTGATIGNHLVLGQTSIDLAKLRSDAVSAHNTYRAKHSSPNVTIDNTLNQSAQAWAETIAAKGDLVHSTNQNNVGENIYWGGDSADLGSAAVQEWYSEIQNYDYNNPVLSDSTGHFTQLVWKGTTKVGCGAAPGPATIDGKKYDGFYVVCQYSPAGNVEGQLADNVLKPQ
ncbi:secretion protein [Nostoc sp. CENA67]|uniref:Secretion protein n=1 Tax=Amazonocrinis nigriterrae CENA67 TaxID=2794033 RepID=A0A8J7LB20_9NOST|nr:CAP family protein [Amazonocrinis nigriterrae]MBH8564826.1 secretion protein [Amazonocrinis nigriterrae CENA67]